jgi:hypothetical protein
VAGARLGRYEILSPVGAGGMGEVYRARDRKLDRDVAIKILPDTLAEDPAALIRFQREAKIVAALSHPNILAIHDFGTESFNTGARVEYAVMELLDGETLRKKLDGGPLSPRKAIDYTLQVAHGIAAAHEKGVVHRDLKPENLFVLKDGRVKILDFGLAHLRIAAASPAGVSAQTILRDTTPGLIVGTVAYMSPEQVRGHDVDWRSDIFTLGVVLYEMISGQRPFRGDSVADAMSAILKEDPPEFARPGPAVPAALDRLTRRCLEKDPRERFQSARDLAFALEAISGASSSSGAAAAVDVRVHGRARQHAMWAAVGLAAGLLVGITPQFVGRMRPADAPSPVRLSAVIPGNDVLGFNIPPSMAISPDGQFLVYQVGRSLAAGQRLDRRSLTDGRVTPIPYGEGAQAPFFSPDGEWLGFMRFGQTGGAKLWKMPIGGGSPQALCDVTVLVGASWGDDGTIVFAPSFDSGLWRVPAAGGVAEPLTTLAKGEESHVWPDILPGANAVIYTVEVAGQPYDNARIVVRPLPSGQPRVLIEGGSAAKYSQSGHLLFGRGNKLMAVPFDLKQLAVTGPAVAMLEGVSDDPALGSVRFALSNQGTLAYVAGGGPRAQR